MSLRFRDIGATIKDKLEQEMSTLKKRQKTSCSLDSQGESLNEAAEKNDGKTDASTQFRSFQKINLFVVPAQFECLECHVCFCFNGA